MQTLRLKKIPSLHAMKNLAFLIPGSQKREIPSFWHQNCGHTPKIACTTNFLADSEGPMSRAKYARVVVLLQYALVKSYGVSNSPHTTSKNWRLTVSVFGRTFNFTALLLKKFHLHLHCDTLACAQTGDPGVGGEKKAGARGGQRYGKRARL